MTRALVHRFQTARRDPAVAVLEGLHALKHALRFGAHVLDIAADESAPVDVISLAAELAELYALGFDDPAPVRALHGRGSGDLLDAVPVPGKEGQPGRKVHQREKLAFADRAVADAGEHSTAGSFWAASLTLMGRFIRVLPQRPWTGKVL
jgi:hypothetical protein